MRALFEILWCLSVLAGVKLPKMPPAVTFQHTSKILTKRKRAFIKPFVHKITPERLECSSFKIFLNNELSAFIVVVAQYCQVYQTFPQFI